MPKLRIRRNNRWEEQNFSDDTFSIGREADNHLVIESFFISRKHCEIRRDEQGFVLTDLGSKIGVQVNHRPVSGEVRLKSGDMLTFADKFEAMFLDTREQTVTTTLISQDADQNFTGAVLTGLDGPTQGQVFGLDKNVSKIGRNNACDVCVPVHTVSQAHAEIVREKRHFILTDLGSVNGSFVNNQRVQRQQLEDGDLVRFDWISFRFNTLESLRRQGTSDRVEAEGHKVAEDPERTVAAPIEPVQPPPLPPQPQEAAQTIPDALHRDPVLHRPQTISNKGMVLAVIALLVLAGGSLAATYFIWTWLF